MNRQTVITVGENRERARIWIQGRYLEQAGFKRGTPILVSYHDGSITIKPDDNGDNHVSGTGSRAPIIDLNTVKISESFPKAKKVKVTVKDGFISITKSIIDLIRDRPNRNTYGEVFAGGGLLSKSAEIAKLKPRWLIESKLEYADILQDNHNCTIINSDVADVMMEDIEQVDVVLGGIPCRPYSIARQNGPSHEEHEDMDLTMFMLPIIYKVKPKHIIFEEVPKYLDSEMGKALIRSLKRIGYNVVFQTVNGDDYGEPTRRGRLVIIATVNDIKTFPELDYSEVKLQDILLPHDHVECKWWNRDNKEWVFNHWDREKAKGNNFVSQIIDENTTRVQALTKRYFSQQAGNPVVKHPYLPHTYRWLTLSEVRKIMGLPDDYILNAPTTTIGEVLGQGVLIRLFSRIISKVIQ